MPASPLFFQTFAVTASPADNTETVIATLTGVCSLQASTIFKLYASCNITGEASATNMILRIRRASLTGTVVAGPVTADTGDITAATAANGIVEGSDAPGDSSGAVYVLTAVMTGAGGVSTVNAATLSARAD